MTMNSVLKTVSLIILATIVPLSGCDKKEEVLPPDNIIKEEVATPAPAPELAPPVEAVAISNADIAGRPLPQDEIVIDQEEVAEMLTEEVANEILQSGTVVFIFNDGSANTELVVDVYHCISDDEVDQQCVQNEAEKVIPGTAYRRTDYCINSCSSKGQSEITRVIEG